MPEDATRRFTEADKRAALLVEIAECYARLQAVEEALGETAKVVISKAEYEKLKDDSFRYGEVSL